MKIRLLAEARKTFRSLEVRNVRLFFAGQLVSQIGTWMRLVAQTLLVLRLTDDGVAVGALMAFQFGPVLVLGPWAGLLADRVDKRRLLIGVQAGAMVLSAALAALATMDRPPLAALYAIAAGIGVATALDNPARRSFIVEMVPETHVQNAVSLNGALMTGSRVIGPAIAGVLVTTVGYAWCFAIDSLSFLAVIAGLLRMDPSALRRPPVTVRGRGQIREGLRYVAATPELRVPLGMMVLIGTLAFNFSVVIPLLVTRSLSGSEVDFTLLFSFLSIGSFIGALWTARRPEVGVQQIVAAAAVFGVAMLVLAAAPTMALAYPAGFLVGLASIGFMTTSTSLLQLRADPSMRGRVLALQAMVFLGSTPFGGPLVGFVAEVASPRWAVALGGVACIVAAVGGWVAHAGDRRRSAVPASAAGLTELEPAAP